MFEGVVPAVACWSLAPADVTPSDLWTAERGLVAGATPQRARDVAAGRVAARRALVALGEPAVAIPADRRMPCWPPGLVGSITHCTGLAAAAVARRRDLHALGIDAEPAVPLAAEVLDLVSTPAEREHDPLAGTVVFSAKESFYKAWSSAGGPLLEFDDVEVVLDIGGDFVARPPTDGVWSGRWAVVDGFVVTSAWARS